MTETTDCHIEQKVWSVSPRKNTTICSIGALGVTIHLTADPGTVKIVNNEFESNVIHLKRLIRRFQGDNKWPIACYHRVHSSDRLASIGIDLEEVSR